MRAREHGGVPRYRTLAAFAAAVLVPIAVTAALLPLGNAVSRDYVFVYLGVVAILGIASGLAPSAVAAAASFVLVDWYFVPPVHTLTIADANDVVNLVVFFGAAGLVGGLGSRRRRAQLRAHALAQQLAAANRDLERLNREQAEAAAVSLRLARTEQQVRSLEETERIRSELFANVSHELRTPLATILTGTTGLLDDISLADVHRREVEGVVAETRRLARLVSDMLDLARIEGGALRLVLADVGLREAVDAAVGRLQVLAPKRAVRVDVAGDLEVTADWTRLGQVLDNLLANADRHSPDGGEIRVEAAPGKRGMVVVRVIDHGEGVTPDQRERIFERFVRGDARGPADGGTGLGLSIARGIVEAHAGRIWVDEPRAGEGSRFAFALPAAEVSAEAREDVHVDVDKEPDEAPQGA